MQTTAHGLRVNREGLGDPRPVAPLEQPLAERLDEHRTLVLGSRSSSPKYLRRRARTATGSATQTSSSRESSTKVGPEWATARRALSRCPNREGVGKLGDRHGRPDDAVDVGQERAKGAGQFVRSDRQPEDGLGVEVLGSEQDRSVDLRLGQGAAMRMES